MSKYHDDSSQASDPLDLHLDRSLVARVHPEPWLSRLVGARRRLLEILDEHMSFGDSRAAIVLSVTPLRIAAYTDELDCAAVLEWSGGVAQRMLRRRKVHVGERMVTINTYERGAECERDLWNGARSHERYSNFHPVIAHLYAGRSRVLRERVAAIDEAEWTRCAEAAEEYSARNEGRARNGCLFCSAEPA